ncbi:uncharacterized protein LOC125568208 [Nematostella vectensis]|uniref:uncharacterized protein LOC125568208 n=1 Tax=Nematostella vectensis TaxID=45351 RepID=UPI0020779382|nr:uncharacterized protein LOC125568208 [Nematostella vectensis]
MCEDEKEKMKKMNSVDLGSWDRAVVTSDGVWHTRGHFSKNGSFIVKNYMTQGLLWYGHKSMRGEITEEEEGEELYHGTAKSMEGVLAEECYGQAKEEGCDIICVWQDGDSSSKKSVHNVYGEEPPQRVYKCGGHVGRSHGNNLKDFAKQKAFTSGHISKWKELFPEMENLKCHCTRHSKNCGCFSEQFLKNARVNHFCCLQQCDSPEEYARRMRALSQHHVVDKHSWEGGNCGFHTETVCSCGECKDEFELKCEGIPYSTKNKLSCPFHHMAYQLECELRAADAKSVIHPEMGRGHSNQCEAHFNVLPHFRAKDQSLNRLHYITSTNCGLAQGNMTWCWENRGKEYHWIKDLYTRLHLPVLPSIEKALDKATEDRMNHLMKQKTEAAKKQRISNKQARQEDQEERKKWNKRQAVLHTYGTEDDDELDDDDDDPALIREAENMLRQRTVISGKRPCKCGSTTHQRTSHKDCSENPKNKE